MSAPQGVWGKRNSHSAARTPQNRSNTASPSQQNPSQPPKQPPTNVWQQRSSVNAANGPPVEEAHKSVNGFNLAEIHALAAQQYVPPTYKPQDTQAGRSSASPWGNKAGTMANGKPFFQELAKQVATLEGGG